MKVTFKILLISSLITFYSSCGNEAPITIFDYPNKIENKIDTIEISYIMWASAYPNWVETDYLEQNSYIPENKLEDKCFFIEAKKGTEKLPEKYHTNFLFEKRLRIKLTGSYYKDNGISRDYMKPTSEKPEHAKVFRYNKFEIQIIEKNE